MLAVLLIDAYSSSYTLNVNRTCSWYCYRSSNPWQLNPCETLLPAFLVMCWRSYDTLWMIAGRWRSAHRVRDMMRRRLDCCSYYSSFCCPWAPWPPSGLCCESIPGISFDGLYSIWVLLTKAHHTIWGCFAMSLHMLESSVGFSFFFFFMHDFWRCF